METSVVTILRGDKPLKGKRVSFEFMGFLPGGVTQTFITNSSGQAYVHHKQKGRVKVYVDGNHSPHKTVATVPSSITVFLN
ncbi:MAG: hypothetical protein F6K30_27285 [Cyanothece sp. SIO2G6]|nr:hypothetical protein [Cyanothece sp. SIO2G6]